MPQLADDVLRPAAHRINAMPESRDAFPRSEFNAIAKADIYHIPYSEDVGGRGLELPTLATLHVEGHRRAVSAAGDLA